MPEAKIFQLIDDSDILDFGVRHFQALLLFLSFSTNYLLSSSVASFLEMAATGSNDTSTILVDDRGTMFYGYLDIYQYAFIGGNLLGGFVGIKMDNKVLLLYVLSFSSLATFLLPYLLYYGGYVTFMVVRTSLGFSEGIVLPMIIGQIARWFPPYERATFAAFIFGGWNFGIILHKTYRGLVDAGLVEWRSMWFFAGAVGLMVTAVWGIAGAHEPETCFYISEVEKTYIYDHCEIDREIIKKKIKFKMLLTNIPFYALLFLHLGYYFGFRLITEEIPVYLYFVHNLALSEVGIVAAVPHIIALLFCIPIAFVSDLMVRKRLLSLEVIRKLFCSIGMFGCAFFILCYGYANDKHLTIFMNSLATSMLVFVNIGLYLNHVEIAPNFACLLMGLSSALARTTTIILPELSQVFIIDLRSASEWKVLLYMTAAVYIMTNIVFVTFGSSNIQRFNMIEGETFSDRRLRLASLKNIIIIIIFSLQVTLALLLLFISVKPKISEKVKACNERLTTAQQTYFLMLIKQQGDIEKNGHWASWPFYIHRQARLDNVIMLNLL